MIIRCIQTGFEAGKLFETTIPNEEGTISVETPWCLTQSDRSAAYSVSDCRAWPFTIGLYVPLSLTISIDNSTRAVSVIAQTGETWRVYRQRNGCAVNGAKVVKGDYSWTSSINGNEIHHYIGPTTVSASDVSTNYTADGGTAVFDLGTALPQQQGSTRQFATFYNYVNGNASAVELTFFNDLPPDYRPGAIYADGEWKSHNRSGGATNILGSDGQWIEMRTLNGGSGTGTPPEIWHNSSNKYNMREIGAS